MKKSIAKKLISALRSGDYIKGTKMMRTSSNKFCIMGVLCNLHAIAHPDIAAKQKYRTQYMGNPGNAPDAVKEWAGISLEWPSPKYTIKGRTESLMVHNDYTGASFNDLADAIEAEHVTKKKATK